MKLDPALEQFLNKVTEKYVNHCISKLKAKANLDMPAEHVLLIRVSFKDGFLTCFSNLLEAHEVAGQPNKAGNNGNTDTH